MVGTTFSGRYKLDEKIASGGMGSVYLATDERLARKVAVKVLKENLADDPRFVERFRREARAVAALSHPNIANVFDYGEEESNHYIVMEMIKGRDLARLLREEGPLDPDRAREIAAETALALGHAHSAGVIHRDVKPGNIIVADDGRVKVTDFGIARAVGGCDLDGNRHRPGLGPLSLARTRFRRRGASRLRHLFARHRVVRDADRRGSLHR